MRSNFLEVRKSTNNELGSLCGEAGRRAPSPEDTTAPKLRALEKNEKGFVLRIIAFLSTRGRVTVSGVKDEYERLTPAKEQAPDRRRDSAGVMITRLAGSLWIEGDIESGYVLTPSSPHGVHALPDDWYSSPPTRAAFAQPQKGTFELDVAALLGKDVITAGLTSLIERDILAIAARWGLTDFGPVMQKMGFRRGLNPGGEPYWTIDSKELKCLDSVNTPQSGKQTTAKSPRKKRSKR